MKDTQTKMSQTSKNEFELEKRRSGLSTEFYSVTIKRVNGYLGKEDTTVDEALEYLNFELKYIHESRMKYTVTFYDSISPVDRLDNMYDANEESLKELIIYIKDKIEQYKSIIECEVGYSFKKNLKKLIWNGQKNSLISIFHQLKRTFNKEKKPLLASSNEDIAAFLKENFECFKDTEFSTINSQLKGFKPPKKSLGTIDI